MAKLICCCCGKAIGLCATSHRTDFARYAFCGERCKSAWLTDWRARVEQALKIIRARDRNLAP